MKIDWNLKLMLHKSNNFNMMVVHHVSSHYFILIVIWSSFGKSKKVLKIWFLFFYFYLRQAIHSAPKWILIKNQHPRIHMSKPYYLDQGGSRISKVKVLQDWFSEIEFFEAPSEIKRIFDIPKTWNLILVFLGPNDKVWMFI